MDAETHHRLTMLRTIGWYEARQQWINVRYKDTGAMVVVSPYRARKDVDRIWILGSLSRDHK